MHFFKYLREKRRIRKYEKGYWRKCIIDGGEHFSEWGCDVWFSVPEKAYTFFSDIELKQIELEIRYNDLVLRKMIEEFE